MISPSRSGLEVMETCTLCGRFVPKLAVSHVYPKALHLLFAEAKDNLPPITINRKASHPAQAVQRSYGGVYGQFVCPTCESELFGPADNEFMRLNHQLSSRPLPDREIELTPHLVAGSSGLLHRFALQSLWRWAVCPRSDFEITDAVGFGPVIERIGNWLLDPAGTLWTNHDVAVSYRIATDTGLVVPPLGGWRAGRIIMTIGKFTFFIASRTRGLGDPLRDYRLQDEDGVRLLATTRMHDWITNPVAGLLGDGRMELTDEFFERMRAHWRARQG